MNQEKGYMALIVILVISATALVVAISVNLLGIEESKMSVTENISNQGQHIADACLNEALIRIKNGHFSKALIPEGPVREENLGGAGCTENWECVKEYANYVYIQGTDIEGESVSNKDYYYLSNIDIQSGTINKITVSFYAYYHCSTDDNVGIHQVWDIIKIEEEQEGTPQDLSKSPQWYNTEYKTNPFTKTSWTEDNINNLIIGLGLTASNCFWDLYGGFWLTGVSYNHQVKVVVDIAVTPADYPAEIIEDFPVSNGLCTINIGETIENQKIVEISATSTSSFGEVSKKIRAKVDVSNEDYISLDCWGYGEDACP